MNRPGIGVQLNPIDNMKVHKCNVIFNTAEGISLRIFIHIYIFCKQMSKTLKYKHKANTVTVLNAAWSTKGDDTTYT